MTTLCCENGEFADEDDDDEEEEEEEEDDDEEEERDGDAGEEEESNNAGRATFRSSSANTLSKLSRIRCRPEVCKKKQRNYGERKERAGEQER